MKQTALTVAKNLRADVDGARDWLRARSREQLRTAFAEIAELHFLSMFIVDARGDQPAQLFLEASFDGSREGFLARLFEARGSRELLMDAFAFCDPCPAAGADAKVWRDFLDRGRVRENIFYVASPGHDVQQIEDERAFAATVQATADQLGAPEVRRAAHVRRIWDGLSRANRDFAMRVPQPPFWVRMNLNEHPLRAIYGRLERFLYVIGLATIVLVAAAAQKIALWPWLTPPRQTIEVTEFWGFVLAVVGLSLVAVCLALYAGEFPAGLTSRMRRHVWIVKLGDLLAATLRAAPAFAAVLGLIALAHWQSHAIARFGQWSLAVVGFIVFVLAAAFAIGVVRIVLSEPVDRATLRAISTLTSLLGMFALVYWLAHAEAWLGLWVLAVAGLVVFVLAAALAIGFVRIVFSEPGDQVDDMTWDAGRLARICGPENDGVQTHFISVAPIRPGALRMATLVIVLWLIGTLATILHNRRGLFNTQSIHFARWCILPGRRLLFISNYDGSFGGYLGIFATLGAVGVSAIWTNTEGFPRGFGLVGDGVRDEQRFKCYARATQVETLLWYRRYPDLTVGAINRNAAIREDLGRFAQARMQDGGHIPEVELDGFLRRLSHRAA